MSLKEELNLRKPIALLSHRALLNVYYTASCLKKRADEFFRPYKLTDVQFNLMALLSRQAGPGEGLSQARISEMMLVNRANITSLVDRMESANLVRRTVSPEDRRSNVIKLTARGKKLFAQLDPLYIKEVKKVMSPLRESEQESLMEMLGKIRKKLSM
ncbi:MAG: MarR family winged helix-turn-helix transcriptional regulator [Planctomycetota bacterium]|jgi:DNA-binding MarR family transcriptional regulator